MKIALASDNYGFYLKEAVKEFLIDNDYDVTDFGIENAEDSTPYYRKAAEIAQKVADYEYDRAILVCGTGMGMAIVANKHPGVYAAPCESVFAAEKSRSINNANILTLGGMLTTEYIAQDIVDVWLNTDFTEGWDESIQQWLEDSMDDIGVIEDSVFAIED